MSDSAAVEVDTDPYKALWNRLQKANIDGIGEVVSVVLLLIDIDANGKQLTHEEFKKAKQNAQNKINNWKKSTKVCKNDTVLGILSRRATFDPEQKIFWGPTEVATFDDAVALLDFIDPEQFRAFKRSKLAAPSTEPQLQPEEAVDDVEEMVRDPQAPPVEDDRKALRAAWSTLELIELPCTRLVASAIGFVMAVTGKPRKESYNMLHNLLMDGSRRREDADAVLNKWDKVVFLSESRNPHWAITWEEAGRLIDLLPPEYTKAYKEHMFLVYGNYWAGAQTLHDEINRNALSTGPLQQLARNAYGISEPIPVPVTNDEDDEYPTGPAMPATKKTKIVGFNPEQQAAWMELEFTSEQKKYMAQCHIQKLELNLKERELDLQVKELQVKQMLAAAANGSAIPAPALAMLAPPVSAAAISIPVPAPLQALMPPGPAVPVPWNVIERPADLLTISTVAKDLGYNLNDINATDAGKDVSQAYQRLNKDAHGNPMMPPRCTRRLQGRLTNTNAYTEKDRPAIEEGLYNYGDKKGLPRPEKPAAPSGGR